MQHTRPPRRKGFTLIDLLAVGGCAAVLFALAAPAVMKARADARSRQCTNNLHQIAIALHDYHETYRALPAGWYAHHRLPGRSYGRGWMGSILPYVEQGALYGRINFNGPLPDANKLLQTRIALYRCPADPTPDVNFLRSNYGTSNYSGNYGFAVPAADAAGKQPAPLTQWLSPRQRANWPGRLPLPKSTNGMFYVNSAVGIADITDGTSHTLFVGERSLKSGAGIWPGVRRNEFVNDQLTDCSAGNEINSGFTAFSSYHPGGAHFVFVDGKVRFLSERIDSRAGTPGKRGFTGVGTFQALSSRNGGEPVKLR